MFPFRADQGGLRQATAQIPSFLHLFHHKPNMEMNIFHLCGWDMKNRLFVTEVKKHFK